MTRTRENKKIYFAWNNGGCEAVCPNGFSHVCQLCLGSHRKRDHQDRGGKGGGNDYLSPAKMSLRSQPAQKYQAKKEKVTQSDRQPDPQTDRQATQ